MRMGWLCIVTVAVLLTWNVSPGAAALNMEDVEVISLRGHDVSWAPEPGLARAEAGVDAPRIGSTIEIPEPAGGYIYSFESKEYQAAASFNILNYPKDTKRWGLDAGRGLDEAVWFLSGMVNLGTLANVVDFPLLEYINPRLGAWVGYNEDAVKDAANPDDKGDLDWGLHLVLVQVSW